MSQILSAPDIVAYRPIQTGQENKFSTFLDFIGRADLAKQPHTPDTSNYVIQVVTQINHGAVLSKWYFATPGLCGSDIVQPFEEIGEDEMKAMNLKKFNAFKNYKSVAENRFYELNVYGPNPINTRYPVINATRPAGDIDL